MRLDWSVVWQNAPALAEGTLLTILLTVVTMAIAVPAGIVIAMMRLSGVRFLASAAAAYVEFFRNLPLILMVY